MTNLQLTHLRFDCTATTPIKLGGHYAGNNLRNALANVMRRSVCPEANRRDGSPPSDAHAATCPACWLLTSNLDPGTVVRAYALVPPMPAQWTIQPGDTFSFCLTLFGEGFRYLPYFVLAITEMGQGEGVGPGRREGDGRFQVHTITAIDPLRGDTQQLLAPGESLVQIPTIHVDHKAVRQISQLHLEHLPSNNEFIFQFLTPMRLEEGQRPYKTPDFTVLFKRTLYRLDELSRQFAGAERRDKAEVAHLHSLAEKVRLLEAETEWHELWTHSSRKGRKTPLSGFTGTAVYRTDNWEPLLPWLIWGQAIQTGKSAVKGNGVYQLAGGDWPHYWDWMQSESLVEA
ncbi:MAG: CRISPR system precrRNA processing endoribonuclease RAMP protein Cas6 [Ardenticatenaceae bacterium]|nr:CRISPR system precrRNA processing endoribonuclease RAMP protein Cas6 [Anaerolineales bacterium]MCB9009404.1 CRISPR system precrRNA processing endoribonuclease RAMP protein Cas6 [Ardenticatenaceae bacterium]